MQSHTVEVGPGQLGDAGERLNFALAHAELGRHLLNFFGGLGRFGDPVLERLHRHFDADDFKQLHEPLFEFGYGLAALVRILFLRPQLFSELAHMFFGFGEVVSEFDKMLAEFGINGLAGRLHFLSGGR